MMHTTMLNSTNARVTFVIDGRPGQRHEYSVPPGGTCAVPAGYVESGILARLAPGLVVAPDVPDEGPFAVAEPRPKPEPTTPVADKSRMSGRGK